VAFIGGGVSPLRGPLFGDGARSGVPIKEEVYPGIELFSQGATPQLSSPLLRFTTEFEMDRCGSTAPWTPGKPVSTLRSVGGLFFLRLSPENCIDDVVLLSPCRQTITSGNKAFRAGLPSEAGWSSPRSISTPPLHVLPRFHVEPINGCSSRDLTGFCHGNTHLEVGFPLRCFQRLSAPHMATQRLPLAR
jgi:hypothetical protein